MQSLGEQFAAQLQRVRVRMENVRADFQQYPRPSVMDVARKYKEVQVGFCSLCGLHSHPGQCIGGKGGVFNMNDPEEKRLFKDWQKRLAEQYGGALRSLTDDELLHMPLPMKVVRLHHIAKELERRMKVRYRQHSRWTTLSGNAPKEPCCNTVEGYCTPMATHFRCAL